MRVKQVPERVLTDDEVLQAALVGSGIVLYRSVAVRVDPQVVLPTLRQGTEVPTPSDQDWRFENGAFIYGEPYIQVLYCGGRCALHTTRERQGLGSAQSAAGAGGGDALYELACGVLRVVGLAHGTDDADAIGLGLQQRIDIAQVDAADSY